MISTLLFDMDGLIFDTEKIYKSGWQYAAKELGFELTDDFYQRFIGVQDQDCETMLCDKLGPSFDLAQFRIIRDKQIKHLRQQGIDYKTGFYQLFAHAKQKGLNMAIVTSSYSPEVHHNFADSNYLHQFDAIITAEDVENGKPQPDCYLQACRRLNVSPTECLVLEDSNNGIRAGYHAGCQTVMIPDLLPPELEVQAMANHIVASLTDVIALLD